MKNQINISNLTPEQIEEIREQLKAYDEKYKSIMDKVKSWEDATAIVHPRFWISPIGKISVSSSTSTTMNLTPSEKHAKSILAACQLMVIAEALNEGSTHNPIWVYFNGRKLEYTLRTEYKYGIIEFKDTITAEYAMAQFEDLWYDYFMIDKIN